LKIINLAMYSFIFLFSILNFIQAQSGVTSNTCYYEQGRSVKTGTLINQITVGGTTVQQNLEACCSLCRGLPNCIAWNYYLNTCFFYRDVLTYDTASSSYYTGKSSASGTPFWKCAISSNTWYFDNSLNWVQQTDTPSRNSANDCCKTCYFKWNTCKSFMYNESLKDCYHSTENFDGKPYVNFAGIHTGNALMSYIP
jgi:hypothetical protein